MFSLAGCTTHRPPPSPEQIAVHEQLKQETAPLPETTPFDADPKKRDAYLDAFHKAWDYVTQGKKLDAKNSIPKGLEQPWNAGWKDGYNIASQHWAKQLGQWQEQHPSPTNSP